MGLLLYYLLNTMNIKKVLKGILRDTNESSYEKVNGQWLSHHDRCHLEVAALPALPMGKDMITGIAGVCIPEFSNAHCTPQYDGLLDECRVAIHQALAYPSACGYVRLCSWCFWMVSRGINPISATLAHRSML